MIEELAPEEFTRADWEDLFRQLTRDMDPWAIDIVELVRRFRAYLAELAFLELEVPGRMVVASAVLLRMKSEWLRDGHGEPPTLARVVDEVVEGVPQAAEDAYVAPELRLPLRRRPRVRASLSDLRRALARVLVMEGRTARPKPALSTEDFGMELDGEPFTRRASRLLRKLLSLVNGERVVAFRRIAHPEPAEQVARLMELLHLDRKGEVRLFQEEFLGEIMIEVRDGAKGAG